MKKRLQNSDLLYIVVLVLFLLAAGLDLVRTRPNQQKKDDPPPATATETTGTTATTATAPPAATDELIVGYYDAVDMYLTLDHTGKYTGKTADIVNEIARVMGQRVEWVALPNPNAKDIELLADPLTAVRPETGPMMRSKPYDFIDYQVRRQPGASVASRAALIDYVKVFYPNVKFVAESDPAAGQGRVVRPSDDVPKEWSETHKFRVPAAIGIAPGNPDLLAAVNAAIDQRLKRTAVASR